MIYKLWKQRIVKQDESNGDMKFTASIGLGGKSASYWKSNKRQSWKWRRICGAYRNPISESNVGHMKTKNKKKAYSAHVVFTIRSGMARRMDWGSS